MDDNVIKRKKRVVSVIPPVSANVESAPITEKTPQIVTKPDLVPISDTSLDLLTAEQREQLRLQVCSDLADRLPIGVEGFTNFYWCVWRKELQPYAEKDWVPAFATGEWTILECFRGAGKTADMTVSYNAYTLGKQPWTFNLVIAASDDTANKSTSLI